MSSAQLRAVSVAFMVCGLGLVSEAWGQPAVSGVSGQWSHKGTVTIQGSGFGTKAQAAPLVWDDASASDIRSKWTGAWPDQSDSSVFYTRYTTPMRGISLPHDNVSRYIAGGHGNSGWTLSVALFKDYNIPAYPQPVYVTYYYRVDDAWNFCSSDNNFKLGSHSQAGGPYADPYWYYEHRNPDFSGKTVKPGIITPYIPSSSGTSFTFGTGAAANPAAGQWVKVEVEALYTNQSSGYVKIWNNGILMNRYNGPTDSGSPGWRAEAVGGYARCYGYSTNWRYFADVYFDTSHARVILGNAPTYTASTKREIQIPTSWSNSSISVTANLGSFAAGETAYLYVVNSSGVVNEVGRAVTIGGGSSAPLTPAAPQNLRITP